MDSINFDLLLKHRQSARSYSTYLRQVNKEHASILSAITQGDVKAARSAMSLHLRRA